MKAQDVIKNYRLSIRRLRKILNYPDLKLNDTVSDNDFNKVESYFVLEKRRSKFLFAQKKEKIKKKFKKRKVKSDVVKEYFSQQKQIPTQNKRKKKRKNKNKAASPKGRSIKIIYTPVGGQPK